MLQFPGLRRLFRLPFRTSMLIKRDVDDELNSHLDRRIGELMDQGVGAEEARHQALEEFGDFDFTRRYCNRMSRRTERRARRWRVISEVSQDLNFGWRLLRRSPGFTLVVVLALALGIGANTTVFSIVNGAILKPGALLRPLQGITEPDRLRELGRMQEGTGFGSFSYQAFTDYRDRNRVFSGLMAYRSTVLDLGDAGETRRVQGSLVSSNYFAVLGARMALGRTFSIDEERGQGAHPVVIISHRLWRSRFGADADILGEALILNGRSFIVVGVADEYFRGHQGLDMRDIWVPLSMFREASPETLASLGDFGHWLTLVGRLKPGISLALAQSEMNTVARRLEEVNPDKNRGAGVALATSPPYGDWKPRDSATVAALFAIVGLLLLVVWANLSSLFLARLAGRRPEIAIRLALGAGRVRVLRQLLSESTLLALLGGAVGLVLALWWDDVLLVWAEGVDEFSTIDLSLDGRVLAFVLLLSIVSGTAVGLASARRVFGLHSPAAMKGLGGATTRSSPLRSLLVVSQLSLSLALLTCAGLMIETVRASEEPISVFEPDQILLVSVQPSHQGYTDARARTFYRLLQEHLEALPWVRSVSLAQNTSPIDGSFFTERVTSGDLGGATDDSWIDAHYNVVAPKYFQTLGVALVAGREFTPEDRDGAASVVIVNETLAHRLWPGESPLGKQIKVPEWGVGPAPTEVREVVGLAKDRPSRSGARPCLYRPLFQNHPWPASGSTLHIRVTGNPMGLLAAVQREVRVLDVNLVPYRPRTLRMEWLGNPYGENGRLFIAVIGVSGVLALLLAAVALYGVISYGVSERTREIGIRMALGARRSDVLRQVLQNGVSIALLGTGIGLLATFALTRVLSSLVLEMNDMSPGVFVGVSLLLTGVALVASYIPARRAASVDPVEALRAE